jgi:large subunit ribosomal protein L13
LLVLREMRLTSANLAAISHNFAPAFSAGRQQGVDMKTFSPTPADIKHDWFVVDARDRVLGRLAAGIAHRLRGKHKPEFAPHMDNGDFIIVVNCEKIRVTGNKLAAKTYYRHSGYVGGLKERTLGKVLAVKPQFALIHAVRGMLPKNRLGRAVLKKLKVYAGPDHPHAAQTPAVLDLG